MPAAIDMVRFKGPRKFLATSISLAAPDNFADANSVSDGHTSLSIRSFLNLTAAISSLVRDAGSVGM